MLGNACLTDQGDGQALRVVDVVKAKPSLDAETVVVGRAIAAVGVEEPVPLDVEGQLAAYPTIGAEAFHIAVVPLSEDPALVQTRRGHEGAGRTGLDAFAAGDAGALTHRVVKVEDNSLVGTSARHADHVVDLDFATRSDAESAINAGVKMYGHGRMRAVGLRMVCARGEAAHFQTDAVHPAPEFGIRVVGLCPRRLIGEQELENKPSRVEGSGRRCRNLLAGRRCAPAGGG